MPPRPPGCFQDTRFPILLLRLCRGMKLDDLSYLYDLLACLQAQLVRQTVEERVQETVVRRSFGKQGQSQVAQPDYSP